MAVFARNAGRPGSGRTQQDIIQSCLGAQDEYGNPFVLITLKSAKPRAANGSTHGYEDTFCSINRGTGEADVKHRIPGRLRWTMPAVGGRPVAVIARTPHNLKKLAREYYDKSWIIIDPAYDKEVKAIADEIRSKMTPEEIAAKDEMIQGMNSSPNGGNLVSKGRNSKEEILNTKEIELNKREIELRKREVLVGRTEVAKNVETIADTAEIGSKDIMDLEDFKKLKLWQMRRVAKQMGYKASRGDGAAQMIAFATDHLHGVKLPPPPISSVATSLADGMDDVQENEVETVG